MQFHYYNEATFEKKKRFELLSNPLLVRSTDISIQYFQRKFSIGEPHYHFFAITQRMARFYVIFSYFDIYFIEGITNTIFQIFTFSGLVITCTILFSLLHWSMLFISISLFIRASSTGTDFHAYRHGSAQIKPHSSNSEWSHLYWFIILQ